AATAAAKADASTNGFADGSNGVTVDVNTGYVDSFTGSSGGVQVQVIQSYPRFFGSVFGSSNVQVTATAVARMGGNANTCLYQLDPNGLPNFNGMNFNGPGCGIAMNGTGNFNGAHVDAASITYVTGHTPNTNGATFVEATPAPGPAVTDPCPDISGCNYLTNNPPATTPCSSQFSGAGGNGYNGGAISGCYSNVNFNGANLSLGSGTYVFTGSVNFNGAHITGSDVTIYFPSNTCGNFNGATLDISPPSTGNTKGVLIYGAPGASSCTPNFNGSSSSVAGLIYYAGYDVNWNGSVGNYTVLVTKSFNFNGSAQAFPSPPPGGALVQLPTLAE
ncbi:MAG TPA: TadG family pilus assembly protein, partial [Candidatus Baltobacteraceae bacterium]|nr:TadG family pilus assembly protein [Candidatus Baltobacteraceae bacterium]